MTSPTNQTSSLVERVKGKAKALAGSLIGDKALEREAELHQEKADALDDAERLSSQAEQDAEEADLARREHELDVERQRIAAEEAAAQREAQLEREQDHAETRIEQRADVEEHAVDTHTEAAQRAAEREVADAARQRTEKQHEAHVLEDQAELARAQAETFDKAATVAEEK